MRVWDIKIHAPDEDGRCRIELRRGSQQMPDYSAQLPPDVVGQFRTAKAPGIVRGAVEELDNTTILDAAADRKAGEFLGEQLLKTLLTDDTLGEDYVGNLIDAITGERDEGSRTWLRFDLTEAGALSELPWEMLYSSDKAVSEFLATSDAVGLSRYREPNRTPPAPARLPLKVLVVVADPSGKLKTDEEVGKIVGALAGLGDANVQLLDPPLKQATRRALAARVAQDRPHVIHYIGHGSFDGTTGRIHLHKDGDPAQTDHVDAQGVFEILKSDRPWLVFLNACEGAIDGKSARFGGLAQELLAVGVPFVIAMRRAISDTAARDFATSFYGNFTRMPLSQAVARARGRLLASDPTSFEFATPALYSSLSGAVAADGDRIVTLAAPIAPPEDDNKDDWEGERQGVSRGMVIGTAFGLALAIAVAGGMYFGMTAKDSDETRNAETATNASGDASDLEAEDADSGATAAPTADIEPDGQGASAGGGGHGRPYRASHGRPRGRGVPARPHGVSPGRGPGGLIEPDEGYSASDPAGGSAPGPDDIPPPPPPPPPPHPPPPPPLPSDVKVPASQYERALRDVRTRYGANHSGGIDPRATWASYVEGLRDCGWRLRTFEPLPVAGARDEPQQAPLVETERAVSGCERGTVVLSGWDRPGSTDGVTSLAATRLHLRTAAIDLAALGVAPERIEEIILQPSSPDTPSYRIGLARLTQEPVPDEWSTAPDGHADLGRLARRARRWAEATRETSLVARVQFWNFDASQREHDKGAARLADAFADQDAQAALAFDPNERREALALARAPSPRVDVRFDLPSQPDATVAWNSGEDWLDQAAQSQVEAIAYEVLSTATRDRLPGNWRLLIEGHSRRGATTYARMRDGLQAASEAQILFGANAMPSARIVSLSCGDVRAALMPAGTDRTVSISILPDGVAAPDSACGWDDPATFTPPAISPPALPLPTFGPDAAATVPDATIPNATRGN